MSKRLHRTLTVVPILAMAGCYPVMAHPTRIESGTSITGGISPQFVLDSSTSQGARLSTRLNMSLGFAVSARDTSEDGIGTRFSAGISMLSLYLGGYAELPRRAFGDWDVGVGVTAHSIGASGVIPYVQAGRTSGDQAFFASVAMPVFRFDSLPRQARLAATLGLTKEFRRVDQRRRSVTAFVTILPGARRSSWECFILCIPPLNQGFHSTLLLVGLMQESPPPRFTPGVPRPPSPFPPRRPPPP